jgi:predicted dehydrogenase
MAESNFSHELGFHLTPDQFRWRGDDSGCPGGALMSMGIHHADTLSYLLGPIESAFAFFPHLYIPAEVEDVNLGKWPHTLDREGEGDVLRLNGSYEWEVELWRRF